MMLASITLAAASVGAIVGLILIGLLLGVPAVLLIAKTLSAIALASAKDQARQTIEQAEAAAQQGAEGGRSEDEREPPERQEKPDGEVKLAPIHT